MPVSRALMWTLAVGLVAWAAWLWPEVPARVPTRFGLDGRPDAWADRSVWSWFGLPLVALALAAGFDVLTRYVVRRPESPMLNLPSKTEILALPPERRAPVLAHVAGLLYTTGALCVLALLLIQVGVWTAGGGADGQPWVLLALPVAVAGPLAALAAGLVRVRAEVERQQVGQEQTA